MEIIFVRHAETKNNVDGIIQGPEHGDINEKGKKEIEKSTKKSSNINTLKLQKMDLNSPQWLGKFPYISTLK